MLPSLLIPLLSFILLVVLFISYRLLRSRFEWETIKQALHELTLEHHHQREALQNNQHQFQLTLITELAQLKEQMVTLHQTHRENFDKHQLAGIKTLQDSLLNHFNHINQHIGQQVDKLTTETGLRLKEISGQVEQRLTQGFEKTTQTFTQIIERLSLIDAAQKKITELSSSVVSLQEVLSDKRSRGAFGEVQLSGLIRNMIPESHFALQVTLSNGKCVDCLLYLPEPTGNVPIDSKFPLENYRIMTNVQLPESERKQGESLFRQDVRKHIEAIADKYILPGETADGAVMFIPAEAVFAQIHSQYPDLIQLAYERRVWLVSPTTLMAVLTTARAVLKDAATRKQVHIIQEHLKVLGQDFARFEKRMEALAKHIDLAHEDVQSVNTSAKKISSRFNKIEKVELPESTGLPPGTAAPESEF